MSDGLTSESVFAKVERPQIKVSFCWNGKLLESDRSTAPEAFKLIEQEATEYVRENMAKFFGFLEWITSEKYGYPNSDCSPTVDDAAILSPVHEWIIELESEEVVTPGGNTDYWIVDVKNWIRPANKSPYELKLSDAKSATLDDATIVNVDKQLFGSGSVYPHTAADLKTPLVDKLKAQIKVLMLDKQFSEFAKKIVVSDEKVEALNMKRVRVPVHLCDLNLDKGARFKVEIKPREYPDWEDYFEFESKNDLNKNIIGDVKELQFFTEIESTEELQKKLKEADSHEMTVISSIPADSVCETVDSDGNVTEMEEEDSAS
jgi:hypothetical protein